MENRYNMYSQGSCGWSSMRNEEFQEQDIWGSVFTETKDSDSDSPKDSSIITKRIPTATKLIPKSNNKNYSENSHERKTVHHSAPVNIPDWSKIYRTKSKNSCHWLDIADSDEDHEKDEDRYNWENDEDEEEYDEEGNVINQPHELIARKIARNEISSFSVFEGAGRTLKGRDLSRVRNAVLTKTGFLESQ